MRPIVLTGFMGCGKSTVAAMLAQALSRELIDTDAELERRCGRTVARLFDRFGEDGFRDREARVLAESLTRPNCVIATGGGAVIREENRRRMRERGTVIWLSVPLPILLDRIERDPSRPLAAQSSRAELTDLFYQRKPYYEECDLLFDTTGKTAEQCAAELIRVGKELWK